MLALSSNYKLTVYVFVAWDMQQIFIIFVLNSSFRRFKYKIIIINYYLFMESGKSTPFPYTHAFVSSHSFPHRENGSHVDMFKFVGRGKLQFVSFHIRGIEYTY